jgi:hypothetical protein
MPDPVRPYLKMQFPATDDQLWGLGLVAYVWTALENDLDMWVYWANQNKMPVTEDGKRIGFRSRARYLKKLVKEQVLEPFRQPFVDCIDGILGVQEERDRLIHWLWGQNSEGEISVADWKEPKKGPNGMFEQREWKVDMDTMVKLATKADGYRATLGEFMFTHGKSEHGFRLSHAWFRMCGKPVPKD